MSVLNHVSKLCRSFYRTSTIIRNCAGTTGPLHEPPYLEAMKSKIPLYDTINIQLKGYDYPVLESYQKYLHNLLRNMDFDIEDSWATPAAHFKIIRYKTKSSVVDSEYKLQIYERTIQVCDLLSTQYPLLLRIIEATLPEGVTVDVHEHDDWSEEVRYVPDRELLQLKTQLEDMQSPKRK